MDEKCCTQDTYMLLKWSKDRYRPQRFLFGDYDTTPGCANVQKHIENAHCRNLHARRRQVTKGLYRRFSDRNLLDIFRDSNFPQSKCSTDSPNMEPILSNPIDFLLTSFYCSIDTECFLATHTSTHSSPTCPTAKRMCR